MKSTFPAIALLLFSSSLPATIQAGVISAFFDDFDGGQTHAVGVIGGLSGVTTTESVQGYSGLGNGSNLFSGDFLRNDSPARPNITPHQGPAPDPALPTTLILSGLPQHTSIGINFLLAIIDSWDGFGTTIYSPDIFNVKVDGVVVFSEYFSEIPTQPNRTQTYVAPAGGLLALNTQLGFFPGFNGDDFTDAAYDMYLEPLLSSIPHTAPSATINWFASGSGWEGGISESWGIENVKIRLGGTVPEPSTFTMFVVGFAGLLAYRCRNTVRARRASTNDRRHVQLWLVVESDTTSRD